METVVSAEVPGRRVRPLLEPFRTSAFRSILRWNEKEPGKKMEIVKQQIVEKKA